MSLQGWAETLITSQVDGSTLTGAATASMLPAAAKYTLQPNFFAIGKQLLIEASGRISLNATPGACTYAVTFGGTTVFDGKAMAMDTAGYTNVNWYLRILMTCRAIGASANLMGQGTWQSTCIAGQIATPPKGGLVAMLPWNTAPAVGSNFDSTTTQQVDVAFTQTVATGSMTCHQYSLISLN